jgi:cytochrome c oxidase accessory protein FixG
MKDPQKNHSPFPAAPQDEILATLGTDGKRRWVDPLVSHGRWLRIRRALGYALIAIFLLGPHLTIAGKPAIFLNMAARQFTFFGVTLHPTDNLILAAFGATVLITFAIITSLWGRLWCGFLCPQPIYMEFIFRPIETFFEGPPHIRKRRATERWTAERLTRRLGKWLAFAGIAFIMAATFVSYFLSWDGLWVLLTTNPAAHPDLLSALGILTALIWYDFSIFREQMCTIACPYGRLQTVVYDQDTTIVGYDLTRGEPRGPLQKRGEPQVLGDCIDCRRCVRTCPTSIDIRRGLQMECIGCAQCIDACDDVMARIGRKPGLIRYTSLRELGGGVTKRLRPRVFVYLGIAMVIYSILGTLMLSRTNAEAEIIRAAQEPFRMLPNGDVANQLRVRLTNHMNAQQVFHIELLSPESGELIVAMNPFTCAPNSVDTLNVVIRLPRSAFQNGKIGATFKITSNAEFEAQKDFLLLGPY